MHPYLTLGCCLLLAFAPAPARAEAAAPVKADLLLERLYPGNTGEIERRLEPTSPTLARRSPEAAPERVLRARAAVPPDDALTSPVMVPVDLATTAALARVADRVDTVSLGEYLLTLGRPTVPEPARTASELPQARGERAPRVPLAASGPAPAEKTVAAIDVNHAPAETLARGLGLDARRARLVVEFRELTGRFRGPADLAQVNGLTDDMIRRWEEEGLLRFEP